VTLVVDHVPRLAKRAAAEIAAEARALLGLIAADAEAHRVRFVPVDG
jgi:hypothetical protein